MGPPKPRWEKPLPGLIQGCRTPLSSPASGPGGHQEPSSTPPPVRRVRSAAETPSPKKRTRLEFASPPRPSTTRAVVNALNHELGEHVEKATADCLKHGWTGVIKRARNSGDLRTTGAAKETNQHPAIPLLQHVGEHGAKVRVRTKPWTQDLKDGCFARGSHQSCADNLDFLRKEMLEFVEKRVLDPFAVPPRSRDGKPTSVASRNHATERTRAPANC